jgi:imidazoleglycerol-phosphate dehydratase
MRTIGTMRTSTIHRKTAETDITLSLSLDGTGRHEIQTGIGFLDHLLTHVAVHGLFDLAVKANGDLYIDSHHTIEDTALVLGRAFDEALGERKGIVRMGSAYVPMDEALAFVVVDLSGRPYAVVQADWHSPSVGQFPTSLIPHFLESLAVTMKANLHARVLYGRDDHHQAEALFKALGRALDVATLIDPRRGGGVPSTKGTL